MHRVFKNRFVDRKEREEGAFWNKKPFRIDLCKREVIDPERCLALRCEV